MVVKRGSKSKGNTTGRVTAEGKEHYVAKLAREGVTVTPVQRISDDGTSGSDTDFEVESPRLHMVPRSTQQGGGVSSQDPRTSMERKIGSSNTGEGNANDKASCGAEKDANQESVFSEEGLASLSIEELLYVIETLFRALARKAGLESRNKFSACAEAFAVTKANTGRNGPTTPMATSMKRKEVTPPVQAAIEKKKKKDMVANGRVEESEDRGTTESWATVAKRGKKVKENISERSSDPSKVMANKATVVARRGEAVALTVAGASFQEAVKKVKEGLKTQPAGLKRIRRSRAGDILMEFNPRVDSSGVMEDIKKTIGSEVKARRLKPTTEVEILDIDPMAPREEVSEALRLAAGIEEVPECRVLRMGAQGMQVAVVACPAYAVPNL